MSSLSRFIELFNSANGVVPPLTTEELEIGKPVAIPTDEDGNNTSVVVTGKVKEGFAGSVTFKYMRVDIGKLLPGIELSAIVPTGINIATQAMSSINAQYGLGVPLEDVVDNVIYFPTATIQLDPESYEWVGELTVSLEYRPVNINTPIVDGDVDGFEYLRLNN